MKDLKKILQENILYIAWVITIFATAGSLFFSQVMGFPPCILCWYQRIAMYPLVILLVVGILRRDKGIYLYVLPLSIAGGFIAAYHNLLYYKILPESMQPCMLGVSCTTKQIEWFGFITIPFMSLVAFIIITACMLIYRKVNKK